MQVDRPGGTEHEATRVLGSWLREVTRLNPDQLPHVRARRAGQQPAAGRPRGHRARTGRPRSPSTTRRLDPLGRVIEVLSEHMCQGLLEGYLLSGRHGVFTCYEAFIHIVDSMFNQHAKWLEASSQVAVAAAARQPELPALVARLAAGPQRLHPSGPRVPRRRREQEPGGRPGVPAAGREHPALHVRPLPAVAAVRQRRRRRQAAAGRLAGREEAALHCARGLGIWEWAGTDDGGRRAARRGAGVRRRRPHAGDARRGFHPARASCRTCGSVSSTWST